MINQTVFGTEMVLLTFILLVVQFVFFIMHLGVVFSKPFSVGNKRFLMLIIFFIFYNLASGLLPDENISMNHLIQNVLAFGSGILLASYYFFFLVRELEIEQRKFFNVKFLWIVLASSFAVFYIIVYVSTGSFSLAKRFFIIIPVIVALYFCYNTIRAILIKVSISSNQSPYRRMYICGNLGITFMATMPIVVAFGDYQVINNGLVNCSFFLMLTAYYHLLYFQTKVEQNISHGTIGQKNKKNVLEIQLTPREKEVTYLILEGLNYTEIAEEMYISNKTVSKHASNIFKKANCHDKNQFIDQYSKPTNSQYVKTIYVGT